MNQFHGFQQRLQDFEHAVLNRIPNPAPYIPNGRDNLERDFKLQFYHSLEMAFLYQFPELLLTLINEMLFFAPYSNEYLTVLDWIAAILAHISLIFFIKTIYEIKRISRRKAYLTHFLNNFILIILQLITLSDIACYQFNKSRLRGPNAYKKNKHVMTFLPTFLINARYIGQFYENIQSYFRLKNHQQILDTIPQIPYKPKGA